MKLLTQTDSRIIYLEGTTDKSSPSDQKRIGAIVNQLKAKHDHGLIFSRISKRIGYRKVTIAWQSKPVPVNKR